MNDQDFTNIKPFEQRPYWNPDAEFILTGAEFERLYTPLAPLIGAGFVLQSVMEREIQKGNVTVKYEYIDGSGEVSQEEVKAMTEKFLEMMKEQQAEQAAQTPVEEVAVDNVKPLNSTGKKTSKIITDI